MIRNKPGISKPKIFQLLHLKKDNFFTQWKYHNSVGMSIQPLLDEPSRSRYSEEQNPVRTWKRKEAETVVGIWSEDVEFGFHALEGRRKRKVSFNVNIFTAVSDKHLVTSRSFGLQTLKSHISWNFGSWGSSVSFFKWFQSQRNQTDPLCLCVWLFISMYVCVWVCVCVRVSVCLSVCFYVSLCEYVLVCVCLPYFYVCLCMCVCVWVPVWLGVCVSVCVRFGQDAEQFWAMNTHSSKGQEKVFTGK